MATENMFLLDVYYSIYNRPMNDYLMAMFIYVQFWKENLLFSFLNIGLFIYKWR